MTTSTGACAWAPSSTWPARPAVDVPADTVEGLAEWIAEHANGESLEKYLQVFALTTAVMQTREQLRRVAREFVEDLVADGVVYGEIRWAPEQHLVEAG